LFVCPISEGQLAAVKFGNPAGDGKPEAGAAPKALVQSHKTA
jgi:hypothetical protein